MAERKQRVVDPDTKLKALALFVMAADHYQQCRAFEGQLGKLLGYDEDDNYLGCLSDEIYDNGRFEAGFKKEGFVVKKAPKKR